MRFMRFVLPITLVLWCPFALADQVVLKNGDRLTGSIVRSDGKSLTFKSEFVGTVNIPNEAIGQITADQPLHLVLKDGQTVVGTVATKEDKLEVQTTDTGTGSQTTGMAGHGLFVSRFPGGRGSQAIPPEFHSLDLEGAFL